MPTPTEVILANIDDVTAAVAVWGPMKAYGTLPAIQAAMSLNTFRTTAPVVLATVERLYSRLSNLQSENTAMADLITILEQKIKEALAREEALRAELAALQDTLPPVTQPVIQGTVQPPKNFEGWTVQTAQDGYIRLYRRVNGEVTSIYLGKTWDPEKAHAKIEARR
jgi:hypothetical protein